jgi:hypothetical protein
MEAGFPASTRRLHTFSGGRLEWYEEDLEHAGLDPKTGKQLYKLAGE